jgi:hypothetical protein
LAAWVTIGLWLEVYEKLDIGNPRVILRDAARQCAYGALCMIVFEYVFRLDLSRFFLVLFSVYAWVLLLLFRLTAGRVVGVIRREFAAPHFVMVVGTTERAVRMARGLEQSSEYGIRLRGFLSERDDAPAEPAPDASLPLAHVLHRRAKGYVGRIGLQANRARELDSGLYVTRSRELYAAPLRVRKAPGGGGSVIQQVGVATPMLLVT